MSVNSSIFFDRWRATFGKLDDGQVRTLQTFIDYWNGRNLTDLRWLAYVMATTHGEVGPRLQPVREGFASSDVEARHHVARLKKNGKIKVNYALPDKTTGKSYYGRGFVQLTHKSNYEAMGKILGLDLVNNPDLALDPAIATKIIFVGMERGTFTGKKLSDYFPPGRPSDWRNARKIINGLDAAEKFANLGEVYHGMLLAAAAVPQPADIPAAPKPAPIPVDLPDTPAQPEGPRGLLRFILDLIMQLFRRK
jgi:putative chitinase